MFSGSLIPSVEMLSTPSRKYLLQLLSLAIRSPMLNSS